MQFQGKHIVVIGTKRSGLAAVKLLRQQGALLRAMDTQAPSAEDKLALERMGVPVDPQTSESLRLSRNELDLIVLSPGVPYDLPLLAEVREQGIPVIGEVELASYFLAGPVIGITGSNGKTTTTALTGHLLKQFGVPSQVGGNIGTAVTSLAETSRADQWNVLELSSFQLESTNHFQANIAACLNITPDHLDRHHTFENYVAAKARLFETQDRSAAAVFNYDDPTCRELAKKTAADVHWFSSSQRVPRGIWLERDKIVWDGLPIMPRSAIKLRGMHNVENVMAASLLALLVAGDESDSLPAAVSSFPGVEHRIEYVRSLHNVDYFNDSKATNVDAAVKAIEAFDGNLWIILGGKDKGAGYLPLREPLRRKGKAALLIGADPPYPYAAAPLIARDLDGVVPIHHCGTLARAVAVANSHATPGDTVLLAPACASFDQFQSYEDRGQAFKQLVAKLI